MKVIICRAAAKEKSRRKADKFLRVCYFPAALIFRVNNTGTPCSLKRVQRHNPSTFFGQRFAAESKPAKKHLLFAGTVPRLSGHAPASAEIIRFRS